MDKTVITNDACSLEAEINDIGWIAIKDKDSGEEISLGCSPNKRCQIVKDAINLSDVIRERRDTKQKKRGEKK